MSGRPHILIVGNPESFHVGSHFERGARSLGWDVTFCDLRSAYAGPRWARALCWQYGRRPVGLTGFSREVLDACSRAKPMAVLTTGLAPVRSTELRNIGKDGILRMNFL